jgi:hypothetical protein
MAGEMIDIVQAHFNFDTPAPPEDDLVAYAKRIFDEMDAATEKFLPFDDYSLYLAVEEGSIKGRGKVAVLAGTLYFGIAQYGSFVQGLEIIARQGRAVARAIVCAASGDEMVQDASKKTRINSGAASRLERLFIKVRDREISPTEATQRAINILDPTGTELPTEAQQKIATALESIRLNPEQLHLDLGLEDEAIPSSLPKPRRNRPMPATQHLFVVIERERKRSQLHFRKEYK